MPRPISKTSTSPSDVQDGDYCALKIVAVAGYNNDWAAYIGPTDWSDEMVKENGDKLAKNEAGVFAYLMQLRKYRGG